jgi:hypothetical protein
MGQDVNHAESEKEKELMPLLRKEDKITQNGSQTQSWTEKN